MHAHKKLKVFLIEDAPKIRSILIEVLQQAAEVEVVGFAEDETDALIQLRATEWDLAIFDIGLKKGSGLGVLAALKKDAKPYGRRVVFSGDPSGILKARIAELGADDFFDKARDMDKLVDYVAKIVTH